MELQVIVSPNSVAESKLKKIDTNVLYNLI